MVLLRGACGFPSDLQARSGGIRGSAPVSPEQWVCTRRSTVNHERLSMPCDVRTRQRLRRSSRLCWSSRIGLRGRGRPLLHRPACRHAPVRPMASCGAVRHVQGEWDRGGGIKSMGLLVDGVAFGDRLVDPASATCKEPYAKVVPCALQVEPTMVVDTTQLANGPHTVPVTVTDVAETSRRSESVLRSPLATAGSRTEGMEDRMAKVRRGSRQRARTDGRDRELSAAAGEQRARHERSRQPIAAAALNLTATATRPASKQRSHRGGPSSPT